MKSHITQKKRGKRHTKGIQVADNPLSRNLAMIFAERENGQILTREDGSPLVRNNKELEGKVQTIREKIMEKHDLQSDKGKALSVGTILGWIRPRKDDASLCLRDPCFKYLAWFAEAIGKNPWDMFLEPEQVYVNHLPGRKKELLKKIIDLSDSQIFLDGLQAIIEMHEALTKNMQGHGVQTTVDDHETMTGEVPDSGDKPKASPQLLEILNKAIKL